MWRVRLVSYVRQNRAGMGTDSPADFRVSFVPTGKTGQTWGTYSQAGFPCRFRSHVCHHRASHTEQGSRFPAGPCTVWTLWTDLFSTHGTQKVRQGFLGLERYKLMPSSGPLRGRSRFGKVAAR